MWQVVLVLASGWGGMAGGGSAGLRVGRCGRWWWCWPQGGEVWQVVVVLLASGWGGVAGGAAGFSSC